MASPGPASPPSRWDAFLLGGLLVVASAIVFYLLYLLFPAHSHYGGLLGIGVVALLFSLAFYLGESLSRRPAVQRALAWGYFGLGFAVLFLTIGLGPSYGAVSTIVQLVGLLVTLAALIVAVALIGWRGRALRRTQAREAPRQAWREEPAPSAFSYAAASGPSVPEAAPPSSPPNPPGGGH